MQDDCHEHRQRRTFEVVQLLAKLQPDLHEQRGLPAVSANAAPVSRENFEHTLPPKIFYDNFLKNSQEAQEAGFLRGTVNLSQPFKKAACRPS
jgi:hypothetical protein